MPWVYGFPDTDANYGRRRRLSSSALRSALSGLLPVHMARTHARLRARVYAYFILAMHSGSAARAATELRVSKTSSTSSSAPAPTSYNLI